MPPRPKPRSSALRWIPPVVLTALVASAWVLYFSGGMRAAYGWAFLLSGSPVVGGVGICLAVGIALRRKRFTAPELFTVTVGVLAIAPILWGFGIGLRTFPYEVDEAWPTATVRLPSDQPLRVLWGGDSVDVNLHAATPAERWAYDFTIEPALLESDRLEDYGCYGSTVVAPANGVVHAVRDGLPDQAPRQGSADFEYPLGNWVVLKLRTGTFLILGHLQKGSIFVRVDDEVDVGQPLGRCGSSGNAIEPHIHLHHQRQDPLLTPTGIAEGLPLYFEGHDGQPMPRGGLGVRGDRPHALGDLVHHEGTPGAPRGG